MKLLKPFMISLIFGVFLFILCGSNWRDSELTTFEDSLSYLVGATVAGYQIGDFRDMIDLDTFRKGVEDQLEDKPLLISDADRERLIQKFVAEDENLADENLVRDGKFMETLPDWRVLIILFFMLLGLFSTVYAYRKIASPLFWFFIFLGVILLTFLLPIRWWTLTIGSIASAFALIAFSFNPGKDILEIIKDIIEIKMEDRVHEKKFQNLMKGIIVCPNCKAVYNRAEVIAQIKQQSPEMFKFKSWSTRFICNKCRKDISI